MKTIDLTPSWEQAMQIYMMCLQNGTNEGIRAAREELTKLAKQMDRLNEAIKKDEELTKLIIKHEVFE